MLLSPLKRRRNRNRHHGGGGTGGGDMDKEAVPARLFPTVTGESHGLENCRGRSLSLCRAVASCFCHFHFLFLLFLLPVSALSTSCLNFLLSFQFLSSPQRGVSPCRPSPVNSTPQSPVEMMWPRPPSYPEDTPTLLQATPPDPVTSDGGAERPPPAQRALPWQQHCLNQPSSIHRWWEGLKAAGEWRQGQGYNCIPHLPQWAGL